MDLTNADLWLFILMKKGILTFEDITSAVDRIKADEVQRIEILRKIAGSVAGIGTAAGIVDPCVMLWPYDSTGVRYVR